MNEKIEEIHQMLRWLIIENLINDDDVDPNFRASEELNQPDISEIVADKKKNSKH